MGTVLLRKAGQVSGPLYGTDIDPGVLTRKRTAGHLCCTSMKFAVKDHWIYCVWIMFHKTVNVPGVQYKTGGTENTAWPGPGWSNGHRRCQAMDKIPMIIIGAVTATAREVIENS